MTREPVPPKHAQALSLGLRESELVTRISDPALSLASQIGFQPSEMTPCTELGVLCMAHSPSVRLLTGTESAIGAPRYRSPDCVDDHGRRQRHAGQRMSLRVRNAAACHMIGRFVGLSYIS